MTVEVHHSEKILRHSVTQALVLKDGGEVFKRILIRSRGYTTCTFFDKWQRFAGVKIIWGKVYKWTIDLPEGWRAFAWAVGTLGQGVQLNDLPWRWRTSIRALSGKLFNWTTCLEDEELLSVHSGARCSIERLALKMKIVKNYFWTTLKWKRTSRFKKFAVQQ